jgi:hypothetical protein
MVNLNRRQLIQKGASLATLAALPPVLGSQKAIAQTLTGRNLILVFCAGGWDVSMVFDPKESGSATVAMPSGSVVEEGSFQYFDADVTNGSTRSFFDTHKDVSAIIRGITVRSISHGGCTKRFLTGGATETAPDFGVLAGHTHGASLPVPYMVLGSTAFVGPYGASAGRVGSNNQVVALLDDESAYSAPSDWPYPQPAFVPDAADDARIQEFLLARSERQRSLRGQYGANQKALEDYETSLEKKIALKAQSAQVGSLNFFTSLGTQMDRAIDLIENDIAWAVSVDTNLEWDSHTNNDNKQGSSYQALFAALDDLITSLKTRNGRGAGNKMIDETTVVVLSEMSRTPQVNNQNGKDHWGYTSALLIGAGVKGGQVFGATDDSLVGTNVNFETGAADTSGTLVETEHFVAGLLQLLGVDPALHLDGVTPFAPFLLS